MNKEEIERIKDLKDIFNKKLENYELDKKFGQLSIDSIYSLFPTEIKLLLDYINQLETNRDEAIEYIKNHIQEGYSEVYDAEMRWDAVSGDDLLEILKGSDK
jgi:hypothetical protein